MSGNRDQCSTSDAENKFMSFCLQLVHRSQWTRVRTIHCGSSVEIPLRGHIAKKFGISKDQMDVDVMGHNNDCYAVESSRSLPKVFTGYSLRICTNDVHTGYVRLINDRNDAPFLILKSTYKLRAEETRHGPAVMRSVYIAKYMNSYVLKNPDVEKAQATILKEEHVPFCDTCPSIHSPYWPAEATEWITRTRTHGFPSKSVIKQVVRYGCDFVEVSHKRLSNDGEWRFSFSKAELIIAKSWTTFQRIVYSTLWVLNKKIGSNNLSTYYFKTLMFWACEEKPVQFWSENSLLDSVCELLCLMKTGIEAKSCCNYFIPGNNMMDHLIDTDLSSEIEALWRTLLSRQYITKVIIECYNWESKLSIMTCTILSPAWIQRALVINHRINNNIDNYTDLFSTVLTQDLQHSLYAELMDIYTGLCFLKWSNNAINKQFYISKSESHLLIAVNLCKSHDKDATYNIDWKYLSDEILTNFIPNGPETQSHEICSDSAGLNIKRRCITQRQNSLNDLNKHKDQLYSRSMNKYDTHSIKDISACRKIDIAMNYVLKTNRDKWTIIQPYKEWPGSSPTVNISWFIAKAHLANLYYTTQRDVSLTIKTCDDIIDVSKQSRMNSIFAENTFPVVLSTQWTSIYDKEIQELLGFYSLCSYVFDASHCSVDLGVCPVQFALYLKLRSSMIGMKDVNMRDSMFGEPAMNTWIADYTDHGRKCEKFKYNLGLRTLHLALGFGAKNWALWFRTKLN